MCVAPVAVVGVDRVGGEDFAGVEVDDGDGGFVDEGEDAFASVVGSDAEVVHPAMTPFGGHGVMRLVEVPRSGLSIAVRS